MIDYYVNMIIQLTENKFFVAINSFAGLLGFTIVGMLAKILNLIKRSKGLENSAKRLEISKKIIEFEIKEKDQIISNYKLILNKEERDFETLQSLFPKEKEQLHALSYVIQYIALNKKLPRVGQAIDGHIIWGEVESNEISLLCSKLVYLIASRELNNINHYHCAKYHCSINQLFCFLNLIGEKAIKLDKNLIIKSDFKSDFENFDLNFVERLYKSAKDSDDLRSVDMLLSIKILELAFLSGNEDAYLFENYSYNFAEEINCVLKTIDQDRKDRIDCIPNTMIAVVFAKSEICSNFNEFDFRAEIIAAAQVFANSSDKPALFQVLQDDFLDSKSNNVGLKQHSGYDPSA